jgi:hypothetical protein
MTMPTDKKPPHGNKQSLMWYSREYGWPLQTVKNARNRRWPLDDPQELLVKVMAGRGKKPPMQKLINLANGQKGPAASPRARQNASASQSEPPAPPPGTTPSEDVAHDLLSGLAAELKRLETETAQSYANYVAELLPAEKLVKQTIYIKNVNALRQLAKDAPKADRDAKNTLPIGDVDSAWSRSFKEFRSSLEAMGRRLATNPLFKKLDPVDVEELVNKETGEIIAHLETGSWLKTEEPAT